MKKAVIILLALFLVLSLCACNQNSTGDETGPTTSVSAYKSTGEYEKLEGQLTWEKINAFPIKSADMTTEELRKLCVDFFRFTKSTLWIPDTDYEIVKDNGEVIPTLTGGKVYGSLPYVGVASGNIYRLMDYMDEETGVVNVQAAGRVPTLFGNQCSIGSWWGWARVINSANYSWTFSSVFRNNFLPVGNLLYPADLEKFDREYGTDEVVREVGMEKLLENYAQMKAGDGLVNYNTAGHEVMIASNAHVEYTADGQIDAGRSYVHVIDQFGEWVDGVNEFGESYTYASNVDAKWTFLYMYQKNYIPFTFGELLGTDPVEKTETSLQHQGDTITKEQLYRLTAQTNYCLTDLYAMIYDSKGNEVMKIASRCTMAGRKKLSFSADPAAEFMETWGSWDNISADKEYTVTVVAQLGTGERPVLWEGKLAQ